MKEKKVVKLRKNNFFKNAILIPFILIIAGIIILAFSPLFNVSEIKVQGNYRLMENTIINISGIEKGQNILRTLRNDSKINSGQISKALNNESHTYRGMIFTREKIKE